MPWKEVEKNSATQRHSPLLTAGSPSSLQQHTVLQCLYWETKIWGSWSVDLTTSFAKFPRLKCGQNKFARPGDLFSYQSWLKVRRDLSETRAASARPGVKWYLLGCLLVVCFSGYLLCDRNKLDTWKQPPKTKFSKLRDYTDSMYVILATCTQP